MVPLIIEMVRKGYYLVTFAAYIVYKKANGFVPEELDGADRGQVRRPLCLTADRFGTVLLYRHAPTRVIQFLPCVPAGP
jgi:hypothetical protein